MLGLLANQIVPAPNSVLIKNKTFLPTGCLAHRQIWTVIILEQAYLSIDDKLRFSFFTDENHDLCDVYSFPYCSSSVLIEPYYLKMATIVISKGL